MIFENSLNRIEERLNELQKTNEQLAKAIQELSVNWGVDRERKIAEIGSKLYKIRDFEAVMVEFERKVYYGIKISPNHQWVWYRKEPPHEFMNPVPERNLIPADPSLQHVLSLLYSSRN